MIYPKPVDILPHNGPMCLVKEITLFVPSEQIMCETSFSKKDFFYDGHFDGNPITPGVILVEALFQTCGIYLRMMKNEGILSNDIIGRAIKIDKTYFFNETIPNDKLIIKATPESIIMNYFNFKGLITIDDKIICKSSLTLI